MLVKLFNLPPKFRYADIKQLVSSQCGVSDMILDNLTTDNNGLKKVTVGLAEEEDGAMLMRKLNGLFVQGQIINVEIVGKKSNNTYNQTNKPDIRPRQSEVPQQQSLAYQPYQSTDLNQMSAVPMVSYPNIYGVPRDAYVNYYQPQSTSFGNPGQQESAFGFQDQTQQSQATINPWSNQNDWTPNKQVGQQNTNSWGTGNAPSGDTNFGRDNSLSWDNPGRNTDRDNNRGCDGGFNQGDGHEFNQNRDKNERNVNRSGNRDFGRENDRDFGRGNDRDFGRGNDRDFGRGNDRDFGRGNDRDFGRGNDRDFGRGNNRASGRGDDRGLVRGNDRDSSRGNDRDFSRGTDHDFRRENDHHVGRGSDRDIGRGTDRVLNRGNDRNNSSGNDRDNNQRGDRDYIPAVHNSGNFNSGARDRGFDRNQSQPNDNHYSHDRPGTSKGSFQQTSHQSHGLHVPGPSTQGNRGRSESHQRGFNEDRNAPRGSWKDREVDNNAPPSKRMKPNFDREYEPSRFKSQGPGNKGPVQNQGPYQKQSFVKNQAPFQNQAMNQAPFKKGPGKKAFDNQAPFQNQKTFQDPSQKPKQNQTPFQKPGTFQTSFKIPHKPPAPVQKPNKFQPPFQKPGKYQGPVNKKKTKVIEDFDRKRTITWRFQIGATIAKDVLNNMGRGIPKTEDFKQGLKFAIVDRLNEMFGDDFSVRMFDMAAKYREKYKVETDAQLVKEVAETIAKFSAEIEATEKAAGRDPDQQLPRTAGTPSTVMQKMAEKLPKYPMADRRVAKALNKENKKIFDDESTLMERLDPAVQKALDEEFNAICKAIIANFPNNVVPEVRDHAKKMDIITVDLKRYLKIYAAKRLLSAGPIILRVFANPKLIKPGQLANLLRNYGVCSLRKTEKKNTVMYIATCETYEQHDKLCTMEPLVKNDTKILCKPFQLLDKFTLRKREMKTLMAIEYKNRIVKGQRQELADQDHTDAQDDDYGEEIKFEDDTDLMAAKIEEGENEEVKPEEQEAYNENNPKYKQEEADIMPKKEPPKMDEIDFSSDDITENFVTENNEQCAEGNTDVNQEDSSVPKNYEDLDMADVDENDLEDY